MVNLMSVIPTMRVKGRSFKITDDGCGKTRMVGKKIYHQSYTSYATKKKNESLTDKKYYALRINHFDNDSFHYGKGITFHRNDIEKKIGISFTVYPDMKLKDNSIKQNFFVLDSVEYGNGIIFRERILDKVLNLYKPEIYKLSDYSKLYIDKRFYPYGNEFMIVK